MRFLLTCIPSSFDRYLYRDLVGRADVDIYGVNEPTGSRVLDFVRRVHKSGRVNRWVRLPYRRIWDRHLAERVQADTCLIFPSATAVALDPVLLRQLRRAHPQNPMVLLLIDSIHAGSIHMRYAKDIIFHFPWDLILSYDKEDCKEYGFTPLGYGYYSMPQDVAPSGQTSDLYYIGTDKGGRQPLVESIYEHAITQGIICNYQISGRHWHPTERKGVHLFRQWVDYRGVFADVQSTNCILECLQQHQHQQSVRYFEAVCCNKKLLTNNPRVAELPYYDPRYMRSFRTADDIDMDWVRTRERIDYHYRGDFSPVGILEKIRAALGGEEEPWKKALTASTRGGQPST